MKKNQQFQILKNWQIKIFSEFKMRTEERVFLLNTFSKSLNERIELIEKPPIIVRVILFLFQWNISKDIKTHSDELKTIKSIVDPTSTPNSF